MTGTHYERGGSTALLAGRPADTEVLFKEAHQRRRRRRRIFMVIVLISVIVAISTALALAGGDSHPAPPPQPAAAAPRPVVARPAGLPEVAWVDYRGQVHIGSLRTHQQRVVAAGHGGAVISMVASGRTLFWIAVCGACQSSDSGPVYDAATGRVSSFTSGVMAYDTATGRARRFASGGLVFNAVDSTDVFVGSEDERRLDRYSVDGRLLRRFTLPTGWVVQAGYELGTSSAALAHGGILVVGSQQARQDGTVGDGSSTFAVWTPATGRIRVLGDGGLFVGTYTDPAADRSLVAWLAGDCISAESCVLRIADLATGTTRQVRSPLGFGFDYRGAFSQDGRQLAVFAKTNSGSYNPETRLALVDVATGSLRLVPGATISIGEPLAWAQWLPGSKQVIVGGLSGEGATGKWTANHFLVDSTTLRSTPFSYSRDRDLDVNYSVVVLP